MTDVGMTTKRRDPLDSVEDDGLPAPEVGAWAYQKYRLIYTYASLFATSMKEKWDQRVYIDLFSGSGRSRIKGSGHIVLASPMLALHVPHRFDRHIFCEENPDLLGALRQRVEALSLPADVRYVRGDVNEHVERVFAEMPPHGRDRTVLAFCFVDPFRLRNLQFATIRQLATRFVDFLVLIPTGMDPGRNVGHYLRATSKVVQEFVGLEDWRDQWRNAETSGDHFGLFLPRIFAEQMKGIGYRYGGLDESVLVRSTPKNLPLYRLGFFSRHRQGESFWRKAKKYGIAQGKLF